MTPKGMVSSSRNRRNVCSIITPKGMVSSSCNRRNVGSTGSCSPPLVEYSTHTLQFSFRHHWQKIGVMRGEFSQSNYRKYRQQITQRVKTGNSKVASVETLTYSCGEKSFLIPYSRRICSTDLSRIALATVLQPNSKRLLMSIKFAACDRENSKQRPFRCRCQKVTTDEALCNVRSFSPLNVWQKTLRLKFETANCCRSWQILHSNCPLLPSIVVLSRAGDDTDRIQLPAIEDATLCYSKRSHHWRTKQSFTQLPTTHLCKNFRVNVR